MSSVTADRPRGLLAFTGVVLGGALALGFAIPAFALEAPSEPDTGAKARSGATSFTPDLQTEIAIGDESRPSDFVSSPDGVWGYATAHELNEFVVISMSERAITKRIPIPGDGGEYVRVSADGTRAYFAITESVSSTGIGVIDLTTNTFLKTISGVPSDIQEIVISRDGKSVYALGLGASVMRFDAESGAELARTQLTGDNAHGMTLIEDDSKLLVGRGDEIFTLDAANLAEVNSVQLANIHGIASLRVDTTDTRVYFADSSASTLGIYNPATGEEISRAKVGGPMDETIGFDSLNRSFGNVPYWDMLMAADFNTGERSESYRETPNAPFSINKNPVTGEILSANGGWINADKGNTVSIVNAPSVSKPSDVSVGALGDTVRFETEAVGIKRGNGGGVTWQSSADGVTWTDIEDAVDEQLDVVVTAENITHAYRAAWYDDFWGQSGASAPAHVLAHGPSITYEGPLADGTVGTKYPDTEITATGLGDLAWSVAEDATVTGLPDGMRLNTQTGTLSGTPTVAGEFTFTVRVTDAFGEDAKTYELRVIKPGGPTKPTEPTEPPNPPVVPDPPGTGEPLGVTGAVSPLALSLIAAGIVAAGGAWLLLARRRPSDAL